MRRVKGRRIDRREGARLAQILKIERALHEQGIARVGGIDEAGRGPLAGPVCAAVVVFPAGTRIARVNDSKKVPPEVREELFEEITARAEGYGVGFADAEEIDAINILNATKLAVKRALRNMRVIPDMLLLDALKIPSCSIPQQSFIKGDAKCFSIAAASIIAKVSRDRLMARYVEQYPQFSFHQHKGYATAEHWAEIDKHGICSIHRRTFFDPGFFRPEVITSNAHTSIRGQVDSAASEDALRTILHELRNHHGFLPRLEIEELATRAHKRLSRFGIST